MSYVPKVGDRVRHPAWPRRFDAWIEVRYVDDQMIAGVDIIGQPCGYELGLDWVFVPLADEAAS